ncbi:MAG: hypothetical protein B0D92_00950 [Spirochaeta sp. LUC14_002_19_P3]|nr:MAG: hypothetical protein B0D92_00950 [Spirochaeta sp. LUC14_002_19_P3]
MSSLAERLARLREAGLAPPPRSSLSPTKAARTPPGSGWKQHTELLWERQLHYPALLPETFASGFILPPGTAAENLLFYDLETTGLSGGTGNTAFLIGLGKQPGNTYTVTQLFLADYPGEPELLPRFKALSGPFSPHISYNGLSFDSQILKTRFLLNRLPPPASLQADLLYPARRLWRGRLPDCGLQTLERKVLNIFRPDDLPGSEAPAAWFEWLEGNETRIGGVFRHNANDIVSLGKLLARLEEWACHNPLGNSPAPSGTPPRCRGMARQWEQHWEPPESERGRQWLQAGWGAGETDCGYELARHHKRLNQHEQALSIWEAILAKNPNEFTAAEELAKYWEHRRRRPQTALAIIARLKTDTLSPAQNEALEYRRLRLERKTAVPRPLP